MMGPRRGGGQAGLAVGHHLPAADADLVILTDEAHIGDSRRKRWVRYAGRARRSTYGSMCTSTDCTCGTADRMALFTFPPRT